MSEAAATAAASAAAPQAAAPVAAPAAAPAPTTPAAAPPAPTAPPVPAAPATPPGAPAGEQDIASLPEWAQALIRNAQQPTAPTAPEPAAPPAPAVDGDLTRLPRWAQQAVTDGQGAAQQLAIQTAVIAAAPSAGADIARLLDSSSAMRALAAVNPNDPAAVTAAIQAAITAQPHLAAGGFSPGRGGAEFGAPTGERPPATLEEAIAARMNGG